MVSGVMTQRSSGPKRWLTFQCMKTPLRTMKASTHEGEPSPPPMMSMRGAVMTKKRKPASSQWGLPTELAETFTSE